MRLKNLAWTFISAALIGTFTNVAIAASSVTEQPKLVIVIDNLGEQQVADTRAANLPGQITCSILPHARYSIKIADLCHAQDKSVILNTPMQAKNNLPLGKGGLHAGMSKEEFLQTLNDDLASVPHLQGLDNLMGSLLTSEQQPMDWVMEGIKDHGLFFLDNKTSPHSVAEKAAKANQVPYIARDVILDDIRSPEAIQKQFNEALKIAKDYGVAVIVAHPDAVSLNFLQQTLPTLAAQGYQLASIPQVLNINVEPVTLTASTVKTSAEAATNTQAKSAVPAAPAIAQQLQIAVNTPKSNKGDEKTIDVPAFNTAAPSPEIEVSVNKDREVIVNSLDQTSTPINNNSEANSTKTAAPQTETIELKASSAAETKPESKPGFFSHLGKKFAGLFHKDKKTTAEKTISAPASTTAPAAATTNVDATQATAKASHSLLQTFQDNLCKKYSRFCEHDEKTTATAQNEFTKAPFNDLRGKLPWPTLGSVSTHFGTDLGDGKLKYNGVLIKAPEGQPVHAIYKGRVIFANWLQGLGLLLIIDHGNGYMSLYGHNEALYKKVGDEVKPDDLIAAVGDSGVPGPSGLYFEIRRNGQPVNPEQWCG